MFFFFKQKTAYEIKECDWSSDVCSSDLKLPGAKIFHFYKELVIPGKDGYKLYNHAKKSSQTKFIRYKNIDSLTVERKDEKISIRFMFAGGKIAVVNIDLIVLCPAVIPASDVQQISKMLETSVDPSGFFEELHGRLDSSRSTIRGIYLAGACQFPMDIQKTMNQGMASTGYILSSLVEGRKLEIEPITASVDSQRCSGCRICTPLCPYKAISFDEHNAEATVNELLCQGCGTCVAACPAAAIKGNHFTQQEIIAEIEGVLK